MNEIIKAITNGTVITVTGKTYSDGTVLVQNGKILEVGERVRIPESAEVYDVQGGYITPGFIDCHTHLSLMPGDDTMPSLDDINEMTDVITPHIKALDALNPFDEALAPVRAAGFTTCYTGPGSANVIGGEGISFKLRGSTAEEMAIPGSEMMKFALGENPKRCYGLQGKMPQTRMATAALLREALTTAREYADEMDDFLSGKGKKPKFNAKASALRRVVRGEERCRIHCHRADDIATAIRIGREFNLDFTIEHCTEGYKITDLLKRENVMCVIGPLLLTHLKREVWGLRQDTPARLVEAGISICLTADNATDTQFLPTHIGIIIREGLPEQAALEAITINPARLLKLEERIGSIEVGKDADLAVFNGNPFCNMTKCMMTMIDGQIYHTLL